MGEQVLGEGDAERAANIFQQILEMAPENPEAISGLARALLAAGRRRRGAREARRSAREGRRRTRPSPAPAPRSRWPRSAPAGDTGGRSSARIAANPDDHRGALRACRRADGARRPRRRRRPIAREHRAATATGTRAPRASGCCNCSKRSGSKIPGPRRSAGGSPRSCSPDGADGALLRVPVFPLAGRAAVSARRSCRCTSSSRATGRWSATRWPATG